MRTAEAWQTRHMKVRPCGIGNVPGSRCCGPGRCRDGCAARPGSNTSARNQVLQSGRYSSSGLPGRASIGKGHRLRRDACYRKCVRLHRAVQQTIDRHQIVNRRQVVTRHRRQGKHRAWPVWLPFTRASVAQVPVASTACRLSSTARDKEAVSCNHPTVLGLSLLRVHVLFRGFAWRSLTCGNRIKLCPSKNPTAKTLQRKCRSERSYASRCHDARRYCDARI